LHYGEGMNTQKITQRPNADDIVLSASGNRWLAIGIGAERFFNDYELAWLWVKVARDEGRMRRVWIDNAYGLRPLVELGEEM